MPAGQTINKQLNNNIVYVLRIQMVDRIKDGEACYFVLLRKRSYCVVMLYHGYMLEWERGGVPFCLAVRMN